VTLSEVGVASDSLLILRKLVGVGVLVCESSLDLLGRWMGVSAMVRAVLCKTIVSACFDGMCCASSMMKLGIVIAPFDRLVFFHCVDSMCCVALYGA
jgi:hypothetical protein